VVAKFNFKTHLKNTFFSHFFHPRLTSKNANLKQNICSKNAIWVSKNAEFYADFESVEKVAKGLM
jgi:hypothetical protein